MGPSGQSRSDPGRTSVVVEAVCIHWKAQAQQYSYVVVNSKTDRNIYEIRPAHGGPSKWVNQKLLIDDPRPGAPAATVELDILHRVDDNDPDENSDDEAYTSSELIAEASPSSTDAANWPSSRSGVDPIGQTRVGTLILRIFPGEAAERLLEAL